MMSIHFIDCYIMRGGTSRGAYFLAADLPSDSAKRDAVLLRVMGSPDERQIDGLGGASMLTSKVAIVSISKRPGVDLDYAFSQVYVDKPKVDSSPTCGNILTAVGCYGIEKGLIKAQDPVTEVSVYDMNTGYTVRQKIQTPGGQITYQGDHAIAGVPGTAAPIDMIFTDIAGAKTGKIFPTGKRMDVVDGLRFSCIDIAMPTVFMSAAEWGVSGYETKKELDAHPDLIARMLEFRKKAAELMGMGDVGDSVIPKMALVAAPKDGGHICGRYFTPFQCHDAFALSASFGAATGSLLQGTLLYEIAQQPANASDSTEFVLEHPAGTMRIGAQVSGEGDDMSVSTRLVRTARLIMRGQVAIDIL